MPYALYSHGRLLGHTEFEYDTGLPGHRMGAFRPTPLGLTLMPVMTGIQRAIRAIATRDASAGLTAYEALRLDRRRLETEYADLAAAESHFTALELELRTPEGVPLPTQWIGVQDTEEARAFAEQLRVEVPDAFTDHDSQEELNAAIAHDLELLDELDDDLLASDQLWEADDDRGEFPRYQILAELSDPL